MDAPDKVWLPGERETLRSLLESLIAKRLLATRERLGRPAVDALDADFWTNFDLEFHKLVNEPALMERLADFISQYWLPQRIPRTFVPLLLLDARTYTHDTLTRLAADLGVDWREDGHVVLIGVTTPAVAQFVKDHRSQIHRLIALLGPSAAHISESWGLRPEQYKALVSRDTLAIVEPSIRLRMIY